MTTTSLRELLDRGEDSLDHLAPYNLDDPHEHLFDILHSGVHHRDQRARIADMMLRLDDDLDTGDIRRGMFEPGVVPPEPRPGFLAERRHLYGWEREVCADPSLVDRAVNAIADPVLRAVLSTKIDFARRPHPFQVVMPEGTWRCDSCGVCFEPEEPAIMGGGQPGFSSPPDVAGYDPTWCAGCFQATVHAAADLRLGVR